MWHTLIQKTFALHIKDVILVTVYIKQYLIHTGWTEVDVPMTNSSWTYAYPITKQFHS